MIDININTIEKIDDINELKELIKELIQNQTVINNKIYNMEKFISDNLLIVL